VFESLAHGFAVALSPSNLLFAVVGVVLGTVVGVLPGIGPPTTVALLLPLTYGLDVTAAVIMLAGIFYGAMYGGSTTSILVNLPGEAASVVTTFDGYQMAQQGRAGGALAIAAIGSFVAGTMGVLGLTVLSVPLSELALRFGPPEYFGLTLFGLTLVAFLVAGSMVRGLLMAALGLWLGMIGLDPVQGTPRFTFGILELADGLDFVPVTMGLFGISEILRNLRRPQEMPRALRAAIDWSHSLREVIHARWAILRGSLVGFFVGILPGGGAIISSLLAYALEKRLARDPSRFGHGAPEGVAAPEAGNNAVCGGALIPMMALGIPGDPITAILIGALLVHGLAPGPMLFVERPDFAYTIIFSFFWSNIFTLAIALLGVRLLVKVLDAPKAVLIPAIAVLCAIGSFALRNSFFDTYVMFAFGLLGLMMRWLGMPVVPLILALVLGRPLEENLRVALTASKGDVSTFFTSPISLGFLLLSAVSIAWPFVQQWRRRGSPA